MKRLLYLVVAIALLFGLLPVGASAEPVTLMSQGPTHEYGDYSDTALSTADAENFTVRTGETLTISQVVVWGFYDGSGVPYPDAFSVRLHGNSANNLPGALIYSENSVATVREPTGLSVVFYNVFTFPEYKYTITLASPQTLTAGTYWLEIYDNGTDPGNGWYWEEASLADSTRGMTGIAYAYEVPGQAWTLYGVELALELLGTTGSPPTIVSQPVNATVIEGQQAVFTAAASGSPSPTVQWQVSTDGGVNWVPISGATSATLSLPNVQLSLNGYQYRAVFSNGIAPNAISSVVSLTVIPFSVPPTIVAQPADVAVIEGRDAQFTAAADGNPTPDVQWYVNTDGGAIWSPIAGATETTLTLPNVDRSQSGYRYLAAFENTVSWADTNPATLTVYWGPEITQQPQAQNVTVGQMATFTVAARGNPAPSVQWLVSADGGASWNNVPDATSTTLSFAAAASDNGKLFYAHVSSEAGGQIVGQVDTEHVLLTAIQSGPPSISTQPESKTAIAGDTVTFTAAATANPTPITVQWQVNTSGKWTNIRGATSSTLTLSRVTTRQSGYQYRAVFANSLGSTPTNAATLTVLASAPVAPTVTTQPSGQSALAGGTATFIAAASGSPVPTVQWQQSVDGGATWGNVSGATSTTLSLTSVTAGMNGYQYRAVFTNSQGTATSSAATLTVTSSTAPVVTAQPVDQTVRAGRTATFTASASGSPTPTVQWQVSTDGGQTWSVISGSTSAKLSLTKVTLSMSGYQYRAVFTSSVGSATSNAAMLTVQ